MVNRNAIASAECLLGVSSIEQRYWVDGRGSRACTPYSFRRRAALKQLDFPMHDSARDNTVTDKSTTFPIVQKIEFLALCIDGRKAGGLNHVD